jgi:tetraacyldisaccharide 4'-kinase
MSLLGVILLPFTFLYSLGIRLRNHLYNIGYSRSFNFDIPVILAGNLSAGGSGKTPMVEYLVRLLKEQYKLSILSRGYKRKTSGFRIAMEEDTYQDIGDEPMQYFNKWKEEIAVVVGEDRAESIPKILFERPETQIILMDDGYQHRSVTPDLKILLTDYSKPFYEDFLLPSGRLREPRKEAKRADVIVVTKADPKIIDLEMQNFRHKIYQYCESNTPIFFSYLKYSKPYPLFDDIQKREFENVIAISGIANSDHFQNYVSSEWNVLMNFDFPDHHEYSSSDLKSIRNKLQELSNKSPAIVTTEKDAVKLASSTFRSLLEGLPIFVISIEMIFLDSGSKFDYLVKDAVESKAGL